LVVLGSGMALQHSEQGEIHSIHDKPVKP